MSRPYSMEERSIIFGIAIDGLSDLGLLEADRSGATAYHACGVYRARGAGRTAKKPAGASSLWTDIDAGEGKQFDTANSAHDAMVDFCNAVGLPQPLYVCSGYGIHAYWPLGVVLDPETWKRYAAGLAALLRQHGIRNERTTDIASILRPPGTHNRKRGVVGVAVIDHQGNLPYDIQQLGLLDVGPAKKNTTTAAVNGHSIAGRLGSISATGPRYSSKKRGHQMRSTPGSEPRSPRILTGASLASWLGRLRFYRRRR